MGALRFHRIRPVMILTFYSAWHIIKIKLKHIFSGSLKKIDVKKVVHSKVMIVFLISMVIVTFQLT